MLSASFSLVTVTVYVFVVLSSAVTTTFIVFVPTCKLVFPVITKLASLLLDSALTVRSVTLYGTVNVYAVVVLTNVGDILYPLILKLFNVASLFAFLVTVTVYVFIVEFQCIFGY